MNTTQASTAQLNKLPLHIVQRIAGSKSRDKQQLTADIAFQLESRGITFVEAEIDPWYVRIEYNGTKIGGIDTTRGKQDYTTLALTADNWSTEWEALILSLFASIDIRNQEQAEPKTITTRDCEEMVARANTSGMDVIEVPGALVDEYALIDDESGTADLIESHFNNVYTSLLTVRTVTADEAYEWVAGKMQTSLEDETDPSLSQAEQILKQRYPKSADRIIERLDESFELELENDKLTIVDNESGSVILAEHNPDSYTWKAYLTNGEFYAVTSMPVKWMTYIANNQD